MSEQHDETRITRGLGREWKISEDCYKVWACCGHTHSAIDVAGDLRRQQGWSANEPVYLIDSIEIETYGPGYEIVKEQHPGSTYEAKFSIAYCVAAGLLTGGAPLDVFSADHFANGDVSNCDFAALLERTRVSVAEDLTAKYPGAWPTRVRITLNDGKTIDGASDFPIGNPENPVSTEQLEAKFTGLVAPRWGQDAAARAIKLVHRLAAVRDMNTPFREFGDGPSAHGRVTQGY
jgi:2-methylcitrate dehydratase PrpD